MYFTDSFTQSLHGLLYTVQRSILLDTKCYGPCLYRDINCTLFRTAPNYSRQMGKSREGATHVSHKVPQFGRTNELAEASRTCFFVTHEETIGRNQYLYSVALYYCWFYELNTDLVARISGIQKNIFISF